jgi:hypothetical protein
MSTESGGFMMCVCPVCGQEEVVSPPRRGRAWDRGRLAGHHLPRSEGSPFPVGCPGSHMHVHEVFSSPGYTRDRTPAEKSESDSAA